MSGTIDPVCAIHGKQLSEHEGARCLYCCLCFKVLTIEECNLLPDGSREDICRECAKYEQEMLARNERANTDKAASSYFEGCDDG